MKKIFSFIMAIAMVVSVANASTTPSKEFPTLDANLIMLPVGNSGKTISLMNLAHISVKDFQLLTGKKLGFFDKFGFKTAQKNLRKKLNDDGTVKTDVAKKLAKKMADGESGFHLGGFALGFFVGLIGVLIAYLINDDYKSNRVKWAWLGLLANVLLTIIIVVAIL